MSRTPTSSGDGKADGVSDGNGKKTTDTGSGESSPGTAATRKEGV